MKRKRFIWSPGHPVGAAIWIFFARLVKSAAAAVQTIRRRSQRSHSGRSRIMLDPTVTMALPVELGCYCVISTAHITAATAAMLDLWAGHLSADAPMTVAATVHGWFVSTQAPQVAATTLLSEDLQAVLAYARALSVDYVLLDCDAPAVSELEAHSW